VDKRTIFGFEADHPIHNAKHPSLREANKR
jgi:hypothetical protein